ncbi:MAG: septation protein A [Gammaproteobacteria bacterium]|nr:septation protein A [Gammaproteobacteria bacterium]NIR28847.1 septation protein A [Gammaproteobacteria bacterium]NIR97228.1 septation protein A [Gammaproteobacteria bacterium]NIT62939.1 septation protein A [Gammaproteobacteria bacterium]NIV20629.1 septation protein A [Gammaproteobacteria bacterium]
MSKLLFDFFPILLFFAAYKLEGIYVATAVAIGASALQVGLHWARHRRVERMHLVALGVIVVFGGATLWLQEEIYIKWKPTVVYWLFAAVFLGSQFVGRQPIVQRVMGTQLDLPRAVWRRLNLGWAGFFVAVGVINLYVVYNFDTATWVDFKLFGLLGLTLGFVLAQALYLSRYLKVQGETGRGS